MKEWIADTGFNMCRRKEVQGEVHIIGASLHTKCPEEATLKYARVDEWEGLERK